MNKERRNKIKTVIVQLEEIENYLNNIKDDEEWAFDSMPEGLQSSMRGEESEESIENMDVALEKIDDAISLLNEIV